MEAHHQPQRKRRTQTLDRGSVRNLLTQVQEVNDRSLVDGHPDHMPAAPVQIPVQYISCRIPIVGEEAHMSTDMAQCQPVRSLTVRRGGPRRPRAQTIATPILHEVEMADTSRNIADHPYHREVAF